MTCPTTYALAIKYTLERAFSPVPTRENGNNATADKQTIASAKPPSRGPCRETFCLSEDGCFLSNCPRPAPDVEILAGRAAL